MTFEDDLYHLAREIDAATASVAQTARDAEQTPLQYDLPGELGSVTVSGAGELTTLNLDVTEMHQYSAGALSRTLLQGIQAAEGQAGRRRAFTIAAAVTETGMA